MDIRKGAVVAGLKRTVFGNPILRTPARRLTPEEIGSERIRQLIADMREYLVTRPKYGVGIAAPQLGQPLAISVIEVRAMPHHPDVEPVSMVIINPEIVHTYGKRAPMWEGCISYGSSHVDFPYAQTYRYKKIRLHYMDEQGSEHEADYDGFLAHVLQHETDHLNGILFVDRVRDPKTYMMKSEFLRMQKRIK